MPVTNWPVEWSEVYRTLNPPEPPEKINPYKLCLVVLVHDYVAVIRCSANNTKFSDQRQMAARFLKLIINHAFLSPEQLGNFIKKDFTFTVQLRFCKSVKFLSRDFDWFVSFLKEFRMRIFDLTDRDNKSIVEKTSVIGHFVRRVWLTTDKSSFTELISFWNDLKEYSRHVSNMFSKHKGSFWSSDVDADSKWKFSFENSCSLPNFRHTNGASGREIRNYILKQVDLIESNPLEAPYEATREWIEQAKRNHVNCNELIFFKCLNAERFNDFVGAEEALHEYFDRDAIDLYRERSSFVHFNWSRSLRYGPLLLAKLNERFGYNEQALMHIQEAVAKAQETNDNECLQYALAEYCLMLSNSNRTVYSELYNAVIKGCRDMNLGSVVEKVQLHKVVADFETGADLKTSLDYLRNECCDMDRSNVEKYEYEQLSSSVLSCLYLALGQIDQAVFEARKLLNNFSTESEKRNGECSTVPSGPTLSESYCVAFCNLALCEYIKGNMAESKKIINRSKQLFKACKYYSHVCLTEAWVYFSKALYCCDFDSCNHWCTRISSVCGQEALLCRSLLKMITRNSENVLSELENMLNCSKSIHIKCRVLLLLIDYYLVVEENLGLAYQYAKNCRTLCENNFILIDALLKRRLALISMKTGDVENAQNLLKSSEISLRIMGNQIELGKSFLVSRKFFAHAAKGQDSNSEMLQKQERLLLDANAIFKNVSALYLEKETAYLLAMFYYQQSLLDKRNKWSKRFKELDKICPGVYPILLI